MESILVTGAAGFIGSHVTKQLLTRGTEVIALDDFNNYYEVSLKEDRITKFLAYPDLPLYRIDICDYPALEKIFKKHRITKVCHLAARAGVRYSISHPFLYQEVNVKGTLHLLELAKQYQVQNFIFASTSSVYGNNTKLPFSESDFVDHPISPYAATKKATELLAHTYAHLYQLPCTGLRYFTVYGPWGRPDMALFLFTKAILADQTISLYNFGKMRRDFTYVDDIVAGTIAALDRPRPYEIINLGNNKPEELSYFVKVLEKNLGKKAGIALEPLQPGDVEATYADIQKAQKLLDFQPKTSIETGIKNFTDWYCSYYGT